MATSKWANDLVMDAALDKVATCTALRVCSGASNPADRAAAVSATLATVTLDSGDFTKADHTSGRKVTIGEQANIDITTSGTATCVTLDDGTTLLYVTTCTSQALVDTGTVTVPAWYVAFADPTP